MTPPDYEEMARKIYGLASNPNRNPNFVIDVIRENLEHVEKVGNTKRNKVWLLYSGEAGNRVVKGVYAECAHAVLAVTNFDCATYIVEVDVE